MSIREKALIYAWLTGLSIMVIGFLIFAYRLQDVILSHAAVIKVLMQLLRVWPELQGIPEVVA